jgi:hypothetical protein
MNHHRTPVPDLGRHHALEFLQEHEQIQRDLMAAHDENKELFEVNCDLANENHLLRDRLKETEERVAFLQGFSRTIITRFDVINEAVTALKKEAWEHGIKTAKTPRVETPAEKVEAAEAASIIARLPVVEYRR